LTAVLPQSHIWSQARYTWTVARKKLLVPSSHPDPGLKIGPILLSECGGLTLCFRERFKSSVPLSPNFSGRIGLSNHSSPFPSGLLLCSRAQSLQPCHRGRVLVVGIGAYRPIMAFTSSLRRKSKNLFFFLLLVPFPPLVALGCHSFQHSCQLRSLHSL
jgi:hypothetical protein